MKFEMLLEELKKSNLQVTVLKFENGRVAVQCGWNYPDEMAGDVFDIAENIGLEVDVCAESVGGDAFGEIRINGGYKRHSGLRGW